MRFRGPNSKDYSSMLGSIQGAPLGKKGGVPESGSGGNCVGAMFAKAQILNLKTSRFGVYGFGVRRVEVVG